MDIITIILGYLPSPYVLNFLYNLFLLLLVFSISLLLFIILQDSIKNLKIKTTLNFIFKICLSGIRKCLPQ